MPKHYEGIILPLYTRIIKRGIKEGKEVFAKYSKRKKIVPGMTLYLYGSGEERPRKIIAKAEISEIKRMKPQNVWNKYSNKIFQNQEEFEEYTKDRKKKEMLVLELKNPELLDNPLKIPEGKKMTVVGLYVNRKMKKELENQ